MKNFPSQFGLLHFYNRCTITAVKIAFLLHLYQPSYQEEATVKKIAEECYVPLLKFFQTKKDFKVTLNTPLSLLELMAKSGYSAWLEGLRELVEQGRVELVGSAAYHPLLTKIPLEYAEKQIILNEYGLGYYFGKHRGFDGEDAILVKDLAGFFPPELAISNAVVNLLDELSYKWVLVNNCTSLDNKHTPDTCVYQLTETQLKLVTRNITISDAIAFNYTSNINNLFGNITKHTVLALDGETFGHHNKQGILLLNNIYSQLKEKNHEITTVTALINDFTPITISNIQESTWADSNPSASLEQYYKYWLNYNNNIQNKLSLLLNTTLNHAIKHKTYDKQDNTSNKALINNIKTYNVLNNVKYSYTIDNSPLLYKLMNSDILWSASHEKVANDKYLYNSTMIRKGLLLYKEYIKECEDQELNNELTPLIQEIEALL